MLTQGDIENQLTQRRLDAEAVGLTVKQLQSQLNALKQQVSNVTITAAGGTVVNKTIITNTSFSTQTDVTSGRALNATYHHTGTAPMLVSVLVLFALSGGTPTGQVDFYTDASATPTVKVGSLGFAYTGTFSALLAFSFIVLPGNYYKTNVSAGSPGLSLWIEWK